MATSRAVIRYAKSLFSLAEERGVVEQMEEDIRTVHAAIEATHELEIMLKSPVIKPDQKERVLESIFESKLSALTMEFLRILVRKGREPLLQDILSAALGLVRIQRNVRTAEVRTAVPMNDAVRTRIMAALKKMHNGDVELDEQVDPSLIGGFQLFMENQMIDASLKRELQLLRRRINDHDYEPESQSPVKRN